MGVWENPFSSDFFPITLVPNILLFSNLFSPPLWIQVKFVFTEPLCFMAMQSFEKAENMYSFTLGVGNSQLDTLEKLIVSSRS